MICILSVYMHALWPTACTNVCIITAYHPAVALLTVIGTFTDKTHTKHPSTTTRTYMYMEGTRQCLYHTKLSIDNHSAYSTTLKTEGAFQAKCGMHSYCKTHFAGAKKGVALTATPTIYALYRSVYIHVMGQSFHLSHVYNLLRGKRLQGHVTVGYYLPQQHTIRPNGKRMKKTIND